MKASINKTGSKRLLQKPHICPSEGKPWDKEIRIRILTRLGMPTSQQETWSHWHHTRGGGRLPTVPGSAALAGQLPLGQAGCWSWPRLPAGNFLAPFPPLSATLLEFPPDLQPFLFFQIHTVHSLTWGRRFAIFYDDCYPLL